MDEERLTAAAKPFAALVGDNKQVTVYFKLEAILENLKLETCT
jgi:hypothetical protein